MKLCICGCGQEVSKEGNRFVTGHNSKRTLEKDKLVLELYSKGLRNQAIVNEVGLGYGIVYRILHKYGIKPDGRMSLGVQKRKKKRTLEKDKFVLKLYDKGLRGINIAKEVGLSDCTVWTILREYGIKPDHKKPKDFGEKVRRALTGKTHEELLGKEGAKRRKEKASKSMAKRWSMLSDEEREKWWKNMCKARVKRPTSFEGRVLGLNEKYGLGFEYVGNGKIWFGNCNPDFINYRRKVVIEVYARYYKAEDYIPVRRVKLGKYGFQVVFLDERDLFGKYWESHCLNKIRKVEAIKWDK